MVDQRTLDPLPSYGDEDGSAGGQETPVRRIDEEVS